MKQKYLKFDIYFENIFSFTIENLVCKTYKQEKSLHKNKVFH